MGGLEVLRAPAHQRGGEGAGGEEREEEEKERLVEDEEGEGDWDSTKPPLLRWDERGEGQRSGEGEGRTVEAWDPPASRGALGRSLHLPLGVGEEEQEEPEEQEVEEYYKTTVIEEVAVENTSDSGLVLRKR